MAFARCLPQQSLLVVSLLASAEFERSDGSERPATSAASLIFDCLKTFVVSVIHRGWDVSGLDTVRGPWFTTQPVFILRES